MIRKPVVPRSTRLSVREVADANDPQLSEAYALLARTFHSSERVSLADWKATLEEKAGGVWTDLAWHLLIAVRGRKVVGLATGTYFGSLNVGMVGYLAIDAGMRSGGLGSRLRQRLRRAFERDAHRLAGVPLAALLGEVSAENPWLRALARRPAVLVLNFPYFQPRLRPSDDPSPFYLYHEAITGPRRPYLAASELRRILYAIWRRGYRIARPLERPAFRLMMRALATRRRIGPVTFPIPAAR